MLKALSDNAKVNISSSLIILCNHIAECYEDEFVSTTGDSAFTFSSQCLLLKLQV